MITHKRKRKRMYPCINVRASCACVCVLATRSHSTGPLPILGKTLLQHEPMPLRHLPSRRVRRDDLVVKLGGDRRKCQSSNSKASKALASIRIDCIARGLERQASLADLEGPQKIIPLAMRRTREFARVLASVDSDIDAPDRHRPGRLLDQQRHVAAAA